MTPKVILFCRLSGQTGRNRLQGLFAFLREKRLNWDIRLPQTEGQFFAEIEDGMPQGIIIGTCDSANVRVLRWVERAKVPAVFIDVPESQRRRRRDADISIRNDNGGIGLMAARHFLAIGGFASYGYVPSLDRTQWSDRRGQGFRTGLRKQPRPVFAYEGQSDADLAAWLKDLPKPAAVYAAWDERARDVVRACKAAKIAIPRQIAVLGTDDDEIVCSLSSPSLSSIRPDTEGQGYRAALWLDKQLNGHVRKTRRTILCKAKSVAERESTRPPPPGKHLVESALDYMRRNHASPLTPESIARHLRCSRRILDMRFAEFHTATVGATLTQIRLEHVKDMLLSSDLSVTEIGAACGFRCPNALKNLFKRTYGQTMRDYRLQRHMTKQMSLSSSCSFKRKDVLKTFCY